MAEKGTKTNFQIQKSNGYEQISFSYRSNSYSFSSVNKYRHLSYEKEPIVFGRIMAMRDNVVYHTSREDCNP